MKTWFLLVAALIPFAGCEMQPASAPVVFTVRQGTFVHTISSRGSVFGDSATEVRCEVDGAGPEGTMILEIVPEGTSVQPGDVLVQLDVSLLKEKLLQQQILCNGLEAEAEAAKNEHEKAQLSAEEYLGGVYPGEKKKAENDLFTAQQELDRAERTLKASGGDAKSDDPSEDADALRFDVEMAKRKVDAAKTRLTVLDTLTKPRQVKQLSGDVKSADAIMRAKKAELAIHADRLAKIQEQIVACTITAPSSGVVFYASLPSETEEDEIFIGDGVIVRPRQVILHITQLDQLSVRIEVAESDLAHLRTNMPATVCVDAMPEMLFDGHVSKVLPYPTRKTRGSTSNKKYEVHVAIENPSGTLRPGLNAEVELTVAELADAIQVPESSVFEENGAKHCLVRSGNGWLVRPVVTGPSDGKIIVIREGLEVGEDVAIQPSQDR